MSFPLLSANRNNKVINIVVVIPVQKCISNTSSEYPPSKDKKYPNTQAKIEKNDENPKAYLMVVFG